MSVVVDLSHVPYREKVNYLNTLLPMLASLRRTSGLPHRIVVDEAHYFLHEPNVHDLVDFDLGAYTLITYRLSDLHIDIRKAVEGIIVKRTTDPREIRTILAMAGDANTETEWQENFSRLTPDEAILLPGIEGTGGKFCKIQLAQRSTAHVRHKAKYVDLQLIESQGFVFTSNGKPIGAPARKLKEFVSSLKTLPVFVLEEHARRGDFSQWIGEIYHDHALASAVRKVEQRYRLGHIRDICQTIAESIEQRYELSAEAPAEEEERAAIAR